jgi:creatinine amidohydrolase
MRLLTSFATALVLGVAAAQSQPSPAANYPGVRLEDLSWIEAEPMLTADSVVVLPLGAAAKEHGPHLALRNDLTLAEYLARRVLESRKVIVAPAITYHFYPAFLEYPGSTSLSLTTARDMTADIVGSLARYGPRRFYVLNTGLSTVRALEGAASALAADGILLRYTDLQASLDAAVRAVEQQAGGSHADEIETSMMLYIDPTAVDMTKAVKDFTSSSFSPPFTRNPGGRGTYSPSGIWGDPTLATREKGRTLVEALLEAVGGDIEGLTRAALPVAAPAQPGAPAAAGRPPGAPAPQPRTAGGCTAGDDRAINRITWGFSTAWANKDADGIAVLWSDEGDILHPDGMSERTPAVIRRNRAQLFVRSEYKFSRHPLQVGHIRCLSNDVAVADGKWELRGVTNGTGQPVPAMTGLFTMVLKRQGAWRIEAYRYTIDAPTGNIPPALLRRPGYPGA